MPRSLRLLCPLALILALSLTLVTASEPAREAEPKKPTPEWKSAKEAADFLLSLSPGDVDVSEIPKLIQQLGDDDFESRDKATTRVTRLGPAALPALECATTSTDAEVARRAKEAVESIRACWSHHYRIWSALRCVRQQRSAEFIPVLMESLPAMAADLDLDDFAWFVLDQLCAEHPGQLAHLERSIEDKLAIRRAAVGFLLSRYGSPREQLRGKTLLQDGDPQVRLRTAQGVLASGSNQAVNTLVELLTCDSIPIAWQAEELLVWFCDGRGPTWRIGYAEKEVRRQCQEEWRSWLRDHPVAKADPNRPRLTRPPGLFASWAGMLWGCDGGVRSQRLKGEIRVFDGHLLANGNRLVCQELASDPVTGSRSCRVVEMDHEECVVWQFFSPSPIESFRRLPTGDIFLTGHPCQEAIWCVLDSSKSIVYQYRRDEHFGESEYRHWRILPDGTIFATAMHNDTLTVMPGKPGVRYQLQRYCGTVAASRVRAEVLPLPIHVPLQTEVNISFTADATISVWHEQTESELYFNEFGEVIQSRKRAGGNFAAPAGVGTLFATYQRRPAEITESGELLWFGRGMGWQSRGWNRKLSLGFSAKRPVVTPEEQCCLLLESPDPEARYDALTYLARISVEEERTVHLLYRALQESVRENRFRAWCVIRCGKHWDPYRTIALMNHPDEGVRCDVIHWISCKSEPGRVTEAIIASISEIATDQRNPLSVRRVSIESLARLGLKHESANERLKALARSSERIINQAATRALETIQPAH